jgi:hypothetical protein
MTRTERVFLVRLCWVTDSFEQCQAALGNSFIAAASKSVILKMVRKPESEGTLQTEHGEDPPAMTVHTLQDVLQCLQSLR